MGLDVVCFGNKQEKLGIFEISYSLHQAIFSATVNWSSNLYLRKIRDYYTTDVRFDRGGVLSFISDLNSVREQVGHQHRASIDILISILSDESIENIHIAGD